ncbi:MAG: hypothetical protein IJI58_04325 [Bacilli bacterium]|nr:hypothetical protein [Bacilli bacterium]
MKIVKDIMCMSTPYGEIYTDDELNGTVVIDDNKVSGILRKEGTAYLTFGKITDETVELIISRDFDKELPKIYEGSFAGRSYYGNKSVITSFDKIPIEECYITVFNPELYRNVEDDEMVKIEKAVEDRKKIMGEESSKLFEQYFNNHKTNDYML